MINCPGFKATFKEENKSFKVSFDVENFTKVHFGEVWSITDVTNLYDGEYEIVPKMTAQTLYTRGKVLSDNIQVKPVPIYCVSNASGGTTIYIANEV